jgi:hypothetical protein
MSEEFMPYGHRDPTNRVLTAIHDPDALLASLAAPPPEVMRIARAPLIALLTESVIRLDQQRRRRPTGSDDAARLGRLVQHGLHVVEWIERQNGRYLDLMVPRRE